MDNSSNTSHGLIGKPVIRQELRRLLEGKGCYVDDINLPRLCHVAFVRSPYAHAKILNIRVDQAMKMQQQAEQLLAEAKRLTQEAQQLTPAKNAKTTRAKKAASTKVKTA